MNPQSEYLVILERGERNWGAYAPDILGCISTGENKEQTRRYLTILQPTPLGNWSTTPTDVPDLVLEFSTRVETLHLLRVALQGYLETQLAAGEALPEPASKASTVTVHLADALIAA